MGVAEGGEARICEQVPMGFRLLMVEKQEPAGTCPWSRLTPNDDFLLPLASDVKKKNREKNWLHHKLGKW